MSSTMKRSMSTSSDVSFLSLSSASSSSSTYSRAADDMLDRLAAVPAESTLHLWSAGNVRLPTGRDLTMPPQEAIELIEAMASDVRFEVVAKVDYGHDVDDWKITFRRTVSRPCSPTSPMSDSE